MRQTLATVGSTSRFRLANDVWFRKEETFGGLAYVSHRDRFFALDKAHAELLDEHGQRPGWHVVGTHDRAMVTALAEAGICETQPSTPQRHFFGPSYIGTVVEAMATQPFVVNCFATAFCPLRCVYCHADDLMLASRRTDSDGSLDRVIAVARATPAMVAVITGGEPLSRPERACKLIEELAPQRALVLDTSGAGDLAGMLPLLTQHRVHVRISLDSADPAVNDELRLSRRGALPRDASAYSFASTAIRSAVEAGLSCSVQTVVTSKNSCREGLLRLRDSLVHRGVRSWVLHVVVPAGKAAQPKAADLLSTQDTLGGLTAVVHESEDAGTPLDIRVTSTDRAPNSVMLIGGSGELCVESADGSGKRALALPWEPTEGDVLTAFQDAFDRVGHARRYLNGALPTRQGPS